MECSSANLSFTVIVCCVNDAKVAGVGQLLFGVKLMFVYAVYTMYGTLMC